MSQVFLLAPDAPISQQARWVKILSGGGTDSRPFAILAVALDQGAARQALAAQLRAVLGSSQDAAEVADADAAKADDSPWKFVDPEASLGEAVRAGMAAIGATRLIVVVQRYDRRDDWVRRVAEEVLPLVGTEVVLLRLGEAPAEGSVRVLAPVVEGAPSKAALRIGCDLLPEDAEITALYVEPDIGADAESVAQATVDAVVASAVGGGKRRLATAVEVANNPAEGVAAEYAKSAPHLLLLGTSHRILLDERFQGSTAARIVRQTPDAAVLLVREALPVQLRLRQRLERSLQNLVPQLARETRVGFTQRVQSSSAWDFDFIALISLATLIASIGLLQNSGSVIIGAMLVAPLMTPILGMGLALVQGNTMLARMAARTICYGVGTAFVLALVVGIIDGDFALTDEMVGRGWPGILDLVVAFVSGLAAAYASTRPGLFSALPGVAIAASLVPPIATSGLAMSRGRFEIAYGSFLLFFTNMVAIVLAASFCLWAVGVRSVKGEVKWLRRIGQAFLLVSIVLAVHLNNRAHIGGRLDLPLGAEVAIAALLPGGFQLLEVAAIRGELHAEVTLQLGGQTQPHSELATELAPSIARILGQPVHLRLAHAWQASAVPTGQ